MIASNLQQFAFNTHHWAAAYLNPFTCHKLTTGNLYVKRLIIYNLLKVVNLLILNRGWFVLKAHITNSSGQVQGLKC
jgi:hypothetical protein